jgi:hypothetical protein
LILLDSLRGRIGRTERSVMGGARARTADLLLVRSLGGSGRERVWLYSVVARCASLPFQRQFSTLAAVVCLLCEVDRELIADCGRLVGWDRCVCGVHVAGVSRIPGAAGLPSSSAEPIGAVKTSP